MTVPAKLRAAAGAAALALALAACSGGEESAETDSSVASTEATPGTGQLPGGENIESPDGSYTFWAEDNRTGPVAATGTGFSGATIAMPDLRGKPVVINTWYASCPPCRAEAEDLVSLADEFDGSVEFVGVNVRDDAATAHAFERSFGIPYESVDGSDGVFVAGLEGHVPLQAVPTTLVLDAKGRPAARFIGIIDPDVARTIITDIAAEG